jgi:hypothetical protein
MRVFAWHPLKTTTVRGPSHSSRPPGSCTHHSRSLRDGRGPDAAIKVADTPERGDDRPFVKRLPPSRPTRSTAAIKRYQCQYKDQCHCKYQCQSNISADNQRQKVTLLRCIRLFQIADDGLAAIVHMDVLDVDNLLTAVAQALENLNLSRILTTGWHR